MSIFYASLIASCRKICTVLKSVHHKNLEIKLENVFESLLPLSYGCGNKIVNYVAVVSLYYVLAFQEICVGILGNMACFQDICMSISKDENLG